MEKKDLSVGMRSLYSRGDEKNTELFKGIMDGTVTFKDGNGDYAAKTETSGNGKTITFGKDSDENQVRDDI